ncbi:DUF2254 domain-containing protein [Algirhabdus cladophorae]|uniref:DUF2254 domain-containing protein n=1 Tax=Algirhabdus cladophorae TaxID=3377108 RepID=UPI003B849138
MGKRAFLFKLLQDVRASYWFLPSLLVLLGVVLASAMIWIDRRPSVFPISLPTSWLDTQADGARALLAVIAQSIIGVTGVMFSMTLVAVSFASGNFGPRLIGNFMRDRGNQWSLGILIATFVYALVVLRTVQDDFDGGASQFVPHYSLLLALGLTLLCVFTLIYFVHHVPETINVSRISASIGAALERQVRELIDNQAPTETIQDPPDRAPDVVVTANKSGYIQTVNYSQLNTLADDKDWFLVLATPIGAFVTEQSVVFKVWTNAPDEIIDENPIAECYAIGVSRTENQNPTFLAEQLVEMIARALSPGVNDPYTAQDCLNRLAAALTVASTYKDGLEDKSLPRIAFSALTFPRLFEASFPLCRQYIKPDALVLRHTLSLLDNLAEVVRPEDQQVIRTEIEKLKTDS